MLLRVEQSRLSHQLLPLRLVNLFETIETKGKGRRSVYSVSPEWKEHDLTNSMKKSLPLMFLPVFSQLFFWLAA